MKIRSRLSLTFLLIVAANLILFSSVVYFTSEYFRQKDFYLRLSDKAKTTARLLIEEEKIDAQLLKLFERNNLTSLPEEQIIVYNSRNQIVYESDNRPDRLADKLHLLERVRQKGEVFVRYGQREIVGLTYRYDSKEFIIIASAYDEYGLTEMRHLRTILGFGLVFGLTLVGISGWFFAGRTLQPISEVVRQVEQITAFNLNQRLVAGKEQDEIAQLAQTFNSMLDRVQKAFEVQRDFVANASHELRTPLTIITGQIEVTLIKPRTPEEHEAKWKTVLESIRRLNNLANNLLELAQVNQDVSTITFQEVALDEVIYDAAKLLTTKQPSYQMIFSFEGDTAVSQPSLLVKGNKSLLTTAFLNLMENACKFSQNKQVEVTLGVNTEGATITFTDQGVGISEEDLKHIYEPFFRAENVKRIHGYGIGLPLTHRIMELHHGRILVTSELNRGTSVVLHLPKLF